MIEIRRRYSVRMKIEADDWESFCHALRQVYLDLDDPRHGNAERIDLCSGGMHASFAVFGEQKPEITHEAYRARIEQYIAQRARA